MLDGVATPFSLVRWERSKLKKNTEQLNVDIELFG